MDPCQSRQIVVIKFGGSVLVEDESYRQVARYLVRRLHPCAGEKFVVVVSAQKGLTDELEKQAREITRHPNPRMLDLLWSTEEIRSVALLTLHLEELGVAAVGLNVHELGLRCTRSLHAAPRVEVLSGEAHRAFDDQSVVIVPGFFGSLMSGTVVSLGRGGSDLTTVLLADEFETGRCELIKDVPGYFTQDPHTSSCATYLPWISYEAAIEMAESGCELVQRLALEVARERGLQLVVRSLDDAAPGTVVSTDTNQQTACRTEDYLAQDDFAKN